MSTICTRVASRRALALVLEWAVEHRGKLMEDWDLCSQLKHPKPIPPLE
jgi:hypothetical protein